MRRRSDQRPRRGHELPSHVVVASKRLVRAGFLPVSLTALLGLALAAPVVAVNLSIIAAALLAPLSLAIIVFVGWWVAKGLTVEMRLDGEHFRVRGWVKDYAIVRSSIDRFEVAEYGGRTVWLLAIEPIGLVGELSVVRVRLTDGTVLDVQSSFARRKLTNDQVVQLNEWLGRELVPRLRTRDRSDKGRG